MTEFHASLDEILIFFPLYKNLKSSGTVFLISLVQRTYVHSKIHESLLFFLMIYGGTLAVHLLSSAIPYLMILHELRDCWCQLGMHPCDNMVLPKDDLLYGMAWAPIRKRSKKSTECLKLWTFKIRTYFYWSQLNKVTNV